MLGSALTLMPNVAANVMMTQMKAVSRLGRSEYCIVETRPLDANDTHIVHASPVVSPPPCRLGQMA